jgi:hypothetical protein
MASNIMNYIPEVLHNVHGVLWAIEQNEGRITTKLIKSEIERLRGQWASEVINIALISLDQKPVVSGMVSSDAQVQALVKMAKKDHEYIIGHIKALRDTREKAKVEPAPVVVPEVHIEVVDFDDDEETIPYSMNDIYDVVQVATLLGVSEQRVRAMIASGAFPHAFKLSGVWAIPHEDIVLVKGKERKAGRPRK